MGRVLWTIRRPAFYGVIVLIYCLFKGISIRTIAHAAFLTNEGFNLFYAYIFWSVLILFIATLFSILFAKYCAYEDSIPVIIGKYIVNDVISPVLCLIQLPMGIIVRLEGDKVDWFGCFFDFFWTIGWIIYIIYGITNYT